MNRALKIAWWSILRLGVMAHVARPGSPPPWWARLWATAVCGLMLPAGLSSDTITITTPATGGFICGQLAQNTATTRSRIRLMQCAGLIGAAVVTTEWLVMMASGWASGLPLLALVITPVIVELDLLLASMVRAQTSDLAGYQAIRATGWQGPVLVVAGLASSGGGLLGEWLTKARARAADQGAALRLTARNATVAPLYARYGFVAVDGKPRAMIWVPEENLARSGGTTAAERLIGGCEEER